MSTPDVPGAKKENNDVLDIGCWAEHEDGSLIYVEGLEGGTVVYSLFDVSADPPVEYRDAMPEKGFKQQFSWKGGNDIRWTWHDKTRFDWSRVMVDFPSGSRHPSAVATMSAAQRVAQSLDLRAGAVRTRQVMTPTLQRAANTIMEGIRDAVNALRP